MATWCGLGCTAPAPDPSFSSERGFVELVAELVAAEDDDLYRFDPPIDATGEVLFRSALARLQRFERSPESDGLTEALELARGISQVRLGDAASAVSSFQAAARAEDLREDALERAAFAERLAALIGPIDEPMRIDDLLPRLDERRRALLDLAERTDERRRPLVLVEVERLDVRTRELMWRHRSSLGVDTALGFAGAMAETHAESRRALEHLLRLADMHAELARAMLAAGDPAGYEFSASRFLNVAQTAASIYAEVASVDGRPEREEARAGLASMEALIERARPGGGR